MCGIGGFYGKGDTATLDKMTNALGRRGPDDRGIWYAGHIGFAHTRLSIIDLSAAGHQPMTSASGHTTIIFNGEIYNFQELKKEIQGYVFTSNTDTEVILALFERYGAKAFEKLEGMFAFALYDHRGDTVYLVRDRMGKKPLYWGVFDDTLIFGSELKSLMQHPAFKKEIDPDAVRMYLTYEYVPTPYSIFKGVRKVQPGGYVVSKKGSEPQEEIYWSLSRQSHSISFEHAREMLDRHLSRAVEKRLMSDVPLGVFLSGGIDSSTVAYYAKKTSRAPVKTFSIGFDDADFDELTYAKIAAKTIGVEHTAEQFSSARCVELIPEVFRYIDEPLADASVLPTYLLSSFTKKHVSVALGGDGADELFAGYPTFRAEQFVSWYRAIPRALRSSLIEPVINALPVRHGYFSADFVLKKFIEGADTDPRYRHQQWLGAFNDREANDLLITPARRSPYAHLDQFFSIHADKEQFHHDLLWSYARTYLMDQVLVKVDRASMAHGLEVRAPFLDHTLVEFVSALPYSYKYRGLTGKYLLKRLMSEKLPLENVWRKKQGFGVPIGRWLQKELRDLSHQLLSTDSVRRSGFFKPEPIQRMLHEHESGTRDHRKKLWTLMTFQLWYDAWMR